MNSLIPSQGRKIAYEIEARADKGLMRGVPNSDYDKCGVTTVKTLNPWD